jgi:hypothetical protein
MMSGQLYRLQHVPRKMDRDWYWLDPRECDVCGLKFVPKVSRMSDFRALVVCSGCLDKENAKKAMLAEADRVAAVANECRERLAMYGMLA